MGINMTTLSEAPVTGGWCRWFGHNFQGRYDKAIPENIKMGGFGSVDFERAIATVMTVTYVGDVCTRCGMVIDRAGGHGATWHHGG